MQMLRLPVFLLLAIMIVETVQAVSPDSSREKLIATELANDLDLGEILWLETAAGNEFPAIFYEAFLGHHDTGIILLHGLGAHPDWPDVIAPLRRALPMEGWPTLSIQLPILSLETPVGFYGETMRIARARIHAAVRYLSNLGFRNYVLLGYGFGAATGVHYLTHVKKHRIDAFIGVSMMARKFLSPGIDLNARLREITIPLLDIYGSRDNPVIVNTAADRRLALKSADNTVYHQLELPDADHYYAGQSTVLVEAVSNWLRSVEIMFQIPVGEEPE